MAWRRSIGFGSGAEAAVTGRMRALADRGRALAAAYTRRPERRVQAAAAPKSASPYARPVAVKVVYRDRARGAFPNAVAVLANYLAKDGPLFGRDGASLDPRDIARAWGDDRRVFHAIVSPNDGHRIDDMAGYARDVLAAWERRTGPLDWAAAVEDKPDRAHPGGNRHLHVMIRGVQDGRDLFLARGVIAHGFREDAMEAATRRLGWMDERERQAFDRQRAAMERLRGRGDAGRDAARELGGHGL